MPCCNQGGVCVVEMKDDETENGSHPQDQGGGATLIRMANEPGKVRSSNGSEAVRYLLYADKVGALCATDYKWVQQEQVEQGKLIVMVQDDCT